MKQTILGGILASTALTTAAFAQETLTAVHAFPESLIYTKSFLEFVDKVNTAGEGVVQIEVRGGPEAIGMFQQTDAVKYLGWFDSGVCYNLWTRNEPSLDAEGNLDVSGLKLRGNAVYNAFFTDYLGAQVIDLPTTEVYSALERGVVDATGWTQIGLIDLKWNEFLNYRIEPCFFSTDLGTIVNLDKWNSLSDEARKILQDVAIEHEKASAEKLGAVRDEDFAKLEEAGMTVVTLEGEAAQNYLAAATENTWNRMKGLMAESPQGDGNYDKLIELFYDAQKNQ